MIEDIFLTYANEPSRNNPKFFQSVFSAVSNNITINLIGVDEAVRHISDVALFNNVKDILDYLRKNGIKYYNEDFRGALYHAMTATADERINHYREVEEFEQIKRKPNQNKLDKKKARTLRVMIDDRRETHFRCLFHSRFRALAVKYTGEDLCEKGFLRKCYECFQLGFRDMLLAIIKDIEFTEIEDFKRSLRSGAKIHFVRTNPEIRYAERGAFREVLMEEQSYAVGYHDFVHGIAEDSNSAFNEFTYNLAMLSLTNFLLRNDRRKLKICPYCNNFFIAKDIKRKHCCYSNDCQKQWGTDKKRKQRETDPVKYV